MTSVQTANVVNELQDLRPADILLGLYQYGIEGCLEGNARQVSAVLVELIGALNFDYEEISNGLFRIYDYCLRLVKAGKLGDVAGILEELRDAWSEALQLQETRASS